MCRMILARYEEYALYRDLLAANCRAAEVEVWAWCPMPNHVHLILMSSDRDGLHRALARVHRCYAGVIRARRKPSGHFWQGRFGAVAVDEEHLAAALRQRVFKRSMPSDLIRGWIPVRVKETRQKNIKRDRDSSRCDRALCVAQPGAGGLTGPGLAVVEHARIFARQGRRT